MSYSGRRVIQLPDGWPSIRRMILIRDSRRCKWGLLPGEYELDGIALGQCSREATEVDHIGDRENHSPDALRAICHEHHKRRTSIQGNMARSAKLAQKLKIRPNRSHPGLK